MFKLDSISDHRKKHGYYTVDGVAYNNKYLALTKKNSTSDFRFNFNDEIFSNYDWSVEPSEDLYEIYKQRAIQLRMKYDNLILYFSGGIDSTTILRIFLDNNIKLDGVVIYGTWKLDHKYGKNNLDVAEQNRAGIPYLKELEKTYNIKIDYHLIDTTEMYDNFKDTDWVFTCNTYLAPRMYAHNFYWQDPWMQKFLDSGNTAFIRGIDKPRIIIEDGEWKLGFLDVQCIDSSPSGMYDAKNDHHNTEYFFWTPDFPKLLSKQCHIIIDYFEKNNVGSDVISAITTKTSDYNQNLYYKYVDPLVYGRYTNQSPGDEKPYFSLPKSIAPCLVQKDLWFYQTSEQSKIWREGVQQLSTMMDENNFNVTTNRGKNQNLSYDQWIKKIYKSFNLNGIDLPELGKPHILWGTVGTWSKLHTIKKYQPKYDLSN